MLNKRIIPCLLLSGRKLVKSIKFKDPKYIGDPINAVKIFNDKEVDEIIILDISASDKNEEPKFQFIQEIVSEAFIPVAYGGGIKNMDHIDKLFKLGIEKVCLNSINYESFDLIKKCSEKYGAQAVVGIVDIKRNLFNQPYVYFKNGKKIKSISDYIKNMQNAGVGEILLQFVDKDGTQSGYDYDLMKSINEHLNVPLVVLGGAGCLDDFSKAFANGADAVAAGSLFVFHGPHKAVLINYPERSEIKKII